MFIPRLSAILVLRLAQTIPTRAKKESFIQEHTLPSCAAHEYRFLVGFAASSSHIATLDCPPRTADLFSNRLQVALRDLQPV